MCLGVVVFMCFRVSDILDGQNCDQEKGPKMDKIPHGVKPDIFKITVPMPKHSWQHQHLPPSLLSQRIFADQHLLHGQLQCVSEWTVEESEDTLHHGGSLTEDHSRIHQIHHGESKSQLGSPEKGNFSLHLRQAHSVFTIPLNRPLHALCMI